MKNGVSITNNTMVPSMKKIQGKLQGLPKLAFDQFVKLTPVRSGNARRKTRLQNNTIVANYPYAKKLDEGHSSQAPEGMSMPTEEFIKRELTRIMRK